MDIDRLDIAIETQAKQASSELTSLYNNLGNIATALNRTSTGYRSAAREVGRFAASMRAISGVQGPDISKTLSQLSRLKRLSNMQTFDPSKFDALTNGLAKLGQMPDVSRSVNGLVNGLTRLSKAGSGMSEAIKNLPALGQALGDIFSSLGQTNVSTSISYLVSSIARLGTSAPKIQAAAQALPLLTAQLRAYIDSMANAPQVNDNTVRLVEAFAQLSIAGKRIGSIGKQVSRSMGDISTSGKQVSTSMDKVHTASNKLMDAFRGLLNVGGSVAKGIGSAAGKIVGHFKKIGSGSSYITKATLSLKNLLQVSLGFYGIRSLINFGKQAVELASDLTEVQNVVENSFGTKGTQLVEDFAKSSVKSLGMSELTAKRVASRFQAMGNAMGITSGQVASATQQVADKIANVEDGMPYDKVASQMGAMSLNLTHLAADMASFYNVEQDTVAEALNAVYTGQTRPLRQYGLDLTQATLQEWANKQGIDAKISSMSQAEKTLLRYQYVMANTATVQGDFARTSQTWANQIRILRQNFEVFGRVIGNVVINAFRPLIVWLNAAMERVIAFAETIGNALGKIFGWKITHTPASNAADVYDTLTDSLDGTADAGDGTSDALKDAKKAAEAYKNTVLGFDELNKLNDVNESTSTPNTGGGSGSGGAGGGLPGADGSGADFTITREKSWLEDYKSEIDSLEELGAYISEKLTSAMQGIQWNTVFDKARGFGTGLADFMNGLITPELFGATGGTIANAINKVLNAEDAFLDKFKFDNLGKSIGTGINSFFDTYDFDLKAKTFYKLINGIISTIKSAADEIKWKSIGSKISKCVKDALKGINWTNAYAAASSFGSGIANFLNGLINEDTFGVIGETVAGALNTALTFLNDFGSTFEWEEFGDSVATAIDNFFKDWDPGLTADTFNKLASGALTAITNAIGGVNWARVGAKISGLLANIEWKQLLVQVGTAVMAAINAALDVATEIFDGTPVKGVIEDLKEDINALAAKFDFETISKGVEDIVKALTPAVSGFASGFLEVFDKFAELGVDFLNGLGGALQAVADALNSLPPGTLEAIGKALGKIAASLLLIKAADTAVNTVGTLVGKLTGKGVAQAAGELATSIGETGTAATNASGPVSGLITKTLATAPGLAALAAGGTMLVAESLDQVRDKAMGGNGHLTEFKELVWALGSDLTPDLTRKLYNLAIEFDSNKTSSEEAAKKLADFFTNENIDPAAIESSLTRVDEQLGFANTSVDTVRKAFELMDEKAVKAAQDASMTSGDYQGLRSALGDVAANAGLSDDALGLLLDVLDRSKASSSTAEGAYKSVRDELTRLYGDTDEGKRKIEEFDKAVQEKVPSAFGTIGEGAADADEKSGTFKTNFWAMAGGAAIQALAMAVLGGAFKGIGDKAEKNEEKIDKFGETTEEMVGGLKLRADEAREFGGNVTTGFAEGMTTTEALQKVTDAIDKVASSAGGGLASYLEIASPSKLTEGYGKYFDEGLANGIGDTTNIGLIETAVKNVLGAIDTKLIEYKDTLYAKGAALTNKLKEGLESVSLSISDVIDLDTSTIETNMYNAGLSAAQSFKNGISSFTMPTLKYSITSYDYWDHDNDGYWDSYTPVFSSYWSAYANGGFPNTGEMFIANESGPEMVGRLGNRNVVANNMQIAEAIKGAVVDGMMEVAMATSGNGTAQPQIIVEAVLKTENDEVLARAVERGRNKRSARFNTVATQW